MHKHLSNAAKCNSSTISQHVGIQVAAVPAEIQQGARGSGDALSWPAEEVELGERPGLLGLHVLQVEASNQKVVTPDVLRHQVHLDGPRKWSC